MIKRPWLTFAGMCSVVFGIVLLCVIMGGYTSLLRTKNRINAVKSLLMEECEKRSDLARDLTAMALETAPPELLEKTKENEKTATRILDRLGRKEEPLARALVLDFEKSQASLTQNISSLFQHLRESKSMRESDKFKTRVKEFQERQEIAAYTARRYNKEVRYFNERKTVFPGFIIGKWFGLYHLTFPEVASHVFQESGQVSNNTKDSQGQLADKTKE